MCSSHCLFTVFSLISLAEFNAQLSTGWHCKARIIYCRAFNNISVLTSPCDINSNGKHNSVSRYLIEHLSWIALPRLGNRWSTFSSDDVCSPGLLCQKRKKEKRNTYICTSLHCCLTVFNLEGLFYKYVFLFIFCLMQVSKMRKKLV